MSQTHLAQADGYSGSSHPGLNYDAAYHRIVFEDRSTIRSYKNILETVENLYAEFKKSERTRLVIRIIGNITPYEMMALDAYIDGQGGTLGIYHNYQPDSPQFSYFTVSFNQGGRNPDTQIIKNIERCNQKYIEKILGVIGNFEEYNIKKIAEFKERGFHLTRDMNDLELESLWGESFGWSRQACEQLLSSTDGSFALGVRTKTKDLIAVVLYSNQSHEIFGESKHRLGFIQHGETTEASTRREFQGEGIMPILVAGLHAELIQQKIYNVYGELRSEDITGDKPNSINHGIKSGKVFHPNLNSPNVLINHVSIGGAHESYNKERVIPGYTSSPTGELRSFLIGAMDPAKFSDKLLQAYSQITHN